MLEAGSGVPLDGGEHKQQALVAFGKGPRTAASSALSFGNHPNDC